MERLTINLTGKTRKEYLNGKEHIVAPVSMLVEGVLNGSSGSLYYPWDEIVKNYEVWNYIPVTVYHPTYNGQPVSARTPDILNSQGVGVILNARINGKLVAEAWLDIEALRRVDNRVLQSLEAGKPIELSTGLFTDNLPAPEGATFNSKPYSFIARNYRPDHLAILPDQVGACSLQDGCGVLVNQADDSEKEIPMPETAPVNNCDCDKKDEVITNLQKEVEVLKKLEPVANAATKGFEDELGNLHSFEDGKWVTVVKEQPVVNKEEEPKKPQTEEEWMASAPAGIRAAVQNAMAIEARERQQLVEELTANVADEAQRISLQESLGRKGLDDLRELKLLIPAKPTANEQQPKPNYFGQTGGSEQPKKQTFSPLPLPTINFADAS